MISNARIATLLRTTSAACLALGLSQGVAAQTVSPSSEQTGASSAAPYGDIVVTAQKREEKLKDVPSSIAVLTGNNLRDQDADTLEAYSARVPGLQLTSGPLGQQQLTIRGLTTGTGFAGTVATYIDDAPVGASNGDGTGGLITPEIDSIDLSRIEVLRGPQGTLYGAANIGGLVKYVTVSPNLTAVDGAASVEGKSVAHGDLGYAVRGRVSIPIVEDKVAILLSGYARRDPGFVDDAALGEHNLDDMKAEGARVALRLKPVDRLTIDLAAIGQNKSSNGFTQIDADPVTLAPLYGPYDQLRARDAEFQRTHVRLYYGTISYDLGGAQLSSTTSYNTVYNRARQDETALFTPFFPTGFGHSNLGYGSFDRINQNKLTEELRLSGSVSDKLNWLVGGYYTREHSSTFVNFPTFDAGTGAPVYIGTILLSSLTLGHYREVAGFGQATYHFTPALELTAGVRYAHNTVSDTIISDGIFAGGSSVVHETAGGSATTFTVAPSYKISNDVTLYARVATGYRPGGANTIVAPKTSYGPDRTTNYEAGFKGNSLGGRLSFAIDGFYVDWTKIQLQVQDTTSGLNYTANAGKASTRGAEGNVSYAVTPDLSFGASGTYVDAHLDRNLPAGQWGQKGDQLPYAPKWKIAATGDYKTPISPDLGAFVGASVFYTSAVSGGFRPTEASPRGRLPGYVSADGRVGLSYGKWTMALLAKNMFDRRAYNGIYHLDSNDLGPVALNIIQPRTISLSLRYNY
ncbi:MAG: TonB-dependent receptor [Sphingomonadales bacterium]|nr:TonB-dependent receptor [Sphingomonadales bacterium]